MPEQTILIIDDSATIRKLADSHLSAAGYRVVLAATAEDGIRMAAEILPALILLDHQLPGTTGYEVCSTLASQAEVDRIPVVISSTLRNKAYAEYVELNNVVDMLPKPYTGELLLTTVANALETAAMVVASQSDGTAVPETIRPVDDAVIAGSMRDFSLRELLDFLNNGAKAGVLEIESRRSRIRFYLDRGRIQGVFASGLDGDTIDAMIAHLPDSLSNLSPILRMTIGGRSSAEFSGFLQLLDQNVLDPRLLRKLLRFQAAMLTWHAFDQASTAFRFDTAAGDGCLHERMPLDCSLLALLVEASLVQPPSGSSPDQVYARRAIRGQNLDRAGLSARHMTLVSALNEPRSEDQLAEALRWTTTEIRQVLRAFQMAELVELRQLGQGRCFVVLEPDTERAEILKKSLHQASSDRYEAQVASDELSFKLLLKRTRPAAILFAADQPAACRTISELRDVLRRTGSAVPLVAMVDPGGSVSTSEPPACQPDATLTRPCTAQAIHQTLDSLLRRTARPEPPSKADDIEPRPTAAIATAGDMVGAAVQGGQS